MFEALLPLTVGVYAVILIFFTLGLFQSRQKRVETEPYVSVIIPALNEKEHIENILHDVTHQTYRADRYEILVVDDGSRDTTANLARALAERTPNLRLLSAREAPHNLKHKKRPLDVGIRASQGEIILVTDADCRVTSRWIDSMVSYFTPEVGLVIGHSQITDSESLREQIEALDFLLLSGAARSTAQLGFPFACTGQNLAYRRAAFDEVGGFSSFADALGGDDNFLLQAIRRRTSWETATALDPNSFVTTGPCRTRHEFLSQRMRWASDSLYFREANPLFFLVIVTTFLANLFPLVSAAWLLLGVGSISSLVNGLVIKFLAEGFLMAKTTSVFRKRELRGAFLPWFLFQMPYVVYMGSVTLLGKSDGWGGRQVR